MLRIETLTNEELEYASRRLRTAFDRVTKRLDEVEQNIGTIKAQKRLDPEKEYKKAHKHSMRHDLEKATQNFAQVVTAAVAVDQEVARRNLLKK